MSINPEKLTFARSVKFNEGDTPTTKRTVTQFQGFDTDTMSFELVIDGTGVASSTEKVADELKTPGLPLRIRRTNPQTALPENHLGTGQQIRLPPQIDEYPVHPLQIDRRSAPGEGDLTFLEYTDVKEAEAIYNSNSPT